MNDLKHKYCTSQQANWNNQNLKEINGWDSEHSNIQLFSVEDLNKNPRGAGTVRSGTQFILSIFLFSSFNSRHQYSVDKGISVTFLTDISIVSIYSLIYLRWWSFLQLWYWLQWWHSWQIINRKWSECYLKSAHSANRVFRTVKEKKHFNSRDGFV